MLTSKKALAIITEMDDEKRDAMINKLSETDAKQLAKTLAKATRNALGDPRKEIGLE